MPDQNAGIVCYMISGNPPGYLVRGFHQYLVDSVDILSYWNHMPGLYFVKSRVRAAELSAKFKIYFEQTPFVIAEVDLDNIDGAIPPTAWHWFFTSPPPYKLYGGPPLLPNMP